MQKFVVFFVLSAALAGCQTHFATPPSPSALAANPDGYKLKRTGNIFSGYYYSRDAEPFDDGEAHRGSTSFDPLFASYPETREGLNRVKQLDWLSHFSLGLGEVFFLSHLLAAQSGSKFLESDTSSIISVTSLISGFLFQYLAAYKFGTLGDAYNAAMERAVLENQNFNVTK